MHYRLFVLTQKEHAKDSEEVRRYVYNELSSDPSFCGEGGRFGSPLCDWFVIGGRWSGELTKAGLDQEKLKAFEKEFGELYGWWTGGKGTVTEEIRAKQAVEVFKKYFPDFQGGHPYWRNSYAHLGYKDDAMIVSKEIWGKVLKAYESVDYRVEDEDSDLAVVDLECDPISERVIGKKWLVVVDYHS